ncbi:ribosome hibernation factor-recruiting GTPase MRF [Williamsia sterculiae]|uniref:GTPase, G3E family n=1 Tax=Williamsia sterculiae TaxID=1344003 RepID=A0A1N7DJM8_9NOCA|nr:GTP-binding protein [Williamsia sterculiae]SIR76026.1 GTPase, G3E family [Williamsia sterculiae]
MVTTAGDRTPVILVAGLDLQAVARAASALLVPGSVVVHHDLRGGAPGPDDPIVRTARTVGVDGMPVVHTEAVHLDHACVSCALREDLLPLLRALHRRDGVDRIVLHLDPLIEPEPLVWAIDNVVVAGAPGYIDGPAGRDVRIEATVGCVDIGSWLDAAGGDVTLAESGHSTVEDERTLAQLAVGAVGFADALVVGGRNDDGWSSARTFAVLARLAPNVPVLMELPHRPLTPLVMAGHLAAIPSDARRGRIDGAHDPLLCGRPPLEEDCGVQIVEFESARPFHPERLHDALDVLLDGVIASRGRLWLATQPDEALWLESAGGGLRVATGGPWLASMSPTEQDAMDPERRAMAALRWHPEFGDRNTSLVIVAHRADTVTIRNAFAQACLTDAEMTEGQRAWSQLTDPFGDYHADPCVENDVDVVELSESTRTDEN